MDINMIKTAENFRTLTEYLIKNKITVSTMESCTSGQIASLITDTEGSSEIYKGGFVTYSNEAKVKCGVPAEIIDTFGVYSKETAGAMASACRKAFGTDIGLGITGSFGNADPANKDSVPGHADFAIDFKGEVSCYDVYLDPEQTRHLSKYVAADALCDKLLEILEGQGKV